jgi:hypothetical protein
MGHECVTRDCDSIVSHPGGQVIHLLRGIEMPDFIHPFFDDEPGRGRKLSTVECAIASAIKGLPADITLAA